jgi:hypothetical protein
MSSLKKGARELGFRPSGACSFATSHPRLAPWAAFLRRFAAGSQFLGVPRKIEIADRNVVLENLVNRRKLR